MKERIAKWTGWKATGKTACFLVLLVLALNWADGVLSLKSDQGIYQIQDLYELRDNSVDVLVAGSSHAYHNIDPGTLWDAYGVAAYDLGAGNQPLWNTYYYIKEAFRTQTPKLVVLEACETAYSEEYFSSYWAFLSTSGMRWSWDKVENIRISVPPEERNSLLLEWVQYHTRYNELSKADFLAYHGDPAKYKGWKGSFARPDLNAGATWPENVQTEERRPMTAKTEEWYRKTIELVQSNSVPLLIVVTPYPSVTAEEQAVFNTASDIAGEYGVPFINLNRDFGSLDLDPATEFYDNYHLNIWGSRKFTKKLGEMLTERYDLPDRRGDLDYQSWEDNARYIEAYARDVELSQGISPAAAADLLLNPNYICAVAVSGSGGTAFAPLLEALGVPAGEEGLWLSSGGVVFWAAGPEDTEYFQLDCHDLKLSRAEGAKSIVLDRYYAVEPIQNGVTIFVYDSVIQTGAGQLDFDASFAGS